MNGCKLFKLAVMAGLILGLLASLIGLIQAAPALAAGSVTQVQAAGLAPGLENIPTRSRPASPPALPPKAPLLQDGTPVLTLTKSADPNPVNAGDVLIYTIAVANGGTDGATGVIISDTLDSDVSFARASHDGTHHAGVVTWEIEGIPAGQTITRSLWVTANQVASGTILSNTAEVTSTEGVTASDTITTTVTAAADLALTKSDRTDPVTTGALVIYTLVVINNGPSNATGVVLTDTLPASMVFQTSTPGPSTCTHMDGIVTCDLGNIGSGGSRQVVIRAYTTLSGVFTNQAEVAANEPDPYAANNRASEDTTVQPADLSVTKSDSPDPVRVGAPLNYRLTVANTGPNVATGIVLTDTLPPGVTFQSSNPGDPICTHVSGSVTCDLGNLPNLGSTSVTIVVIPTTAGIITNRAEVAANEPDPDPADNTATATTTVNAAADLEVSKGDTPDPAIAGENLTYTLIVTNNGPSRATGVVLTDTLPAGVTLVSAPGCSELSGSVTCNLHNITSGHRAQVTLVVAVGSSTTGTLTNHAGVRGNEFDPDMANNSASAATTVNKETDLEIAKSDDPDPVIAGEILTYTLTATNHGPSDASGIVVTDILPPGVTFQSSSPGTPTCTHAGNSVTCNLGDLANDDNTQVSIQAKVNSSTQGALTNSASVTGNESDPNGGNNSAPEDTTVNTEADLAVTQNSSPSPVLPGDELTYHITVTNNGPSDAMGATLTDTLPSGVSFQSSTPGAPTCTYAGGDVTCDLDVLGSAGTASVDILVTVAPGAEGNLANTTRVSSSTFDPNSDNNSDTENILVGEVGITSIYLPIVFKPALTELSVFNDNTGGDVKFTVLGTGVSCMVANNVVQFCGSFPPGTYMVEVVSTCGTGRFPKTYDSGPQTTRVFCD
jgi:uncharacterized repeat protein (TIGR01451 family)